MLRVSGIFAKFVLALAGRRYVLRCIVARIACESVVRMRCAECSIAFAIGATSLLVGVVGACWWVICWIVCWVRIVVLLVVLR